MPIDTSSASGRIFIRKPLSKNKTYFRGKIYDIASQDEFEAEVRKIVKQPELLMQREIDLAAVSYDFESNSWRLLRDFGTSQLYYAEINGGLAWSFTYKGLLDLLGDAQEDEATLFDYLATHYRYIFRDAGRTFHKNVRQVPAGSFIDFGPQGLKIKSWLKMEPDSDIYELSPDEASERLMELLRRSIHLRAKASEKAAFTVSSGLDSSTVASLASETLGAIDVFSVGYSGPGVSEYDESEGIKELLSGKNWRWTHLLMESPDLITEAEKLIKATGSPIVTVTWLAYYLMGKQLGGYKEIFSGLGGDECLAGEFVHFFYHFADLKKNGQTNRLWPEVEAWSQLHDHPIFKKNKTVLEKFWAKNINFNNGEMYVDQAVYKKNWHFFNDDFIESYGLATPPMPCPYPDFLSNRLYQEFIHETTTPTLWGFAMANQVLGLRAISPFLSPEIFRFCLALPGSVKYDNALTKALLRRGLKGVLPENIRMNHKKIGFNAPIDQWFKEAKVSGPLLDLLHYGPLAKKGWLKKGAAEKIFKEHEAGLANHMMLLWPLLNASLFLS